MQINIAAAMQPLATQLFELLRGIRTEQARTNDLLDQMLAIQRRSEVLK